MQVFARLDCLLSHSTPLSQTLRPSYCFRENYTHLRCKLNCNFDADHQREGSGWWTTATTWAGGNVSSYYLRFNSDSGNNYNWSQGYAFTGASVVAAYAVSVGLIQLGGIPTSTNANFVGTSIITIDNYKDTTFYKTLLCSTSATVNTGPFTFFNSGAWRNTAAITQIDITAGIASEKFIIGTTAYLYGLN
jgi:hypothetical protein